MRVLVTGATGFIGKSLLLRLQQDHHEVIAWVRDLARARAALGPDIQLVHTSDDDGLARALQTTDAVINLAGAPILDKRWTDKRRAQLWDSRVGVTRRIVDAIAGVASKPSVLVSASAIGYYADAGELPISESGQRGKGFAAELCATWEHEASRATELGLRVAHARIGIVLGQGGMLDKVLPLFRSGLGGRLGSGQQYLPWIHVEDVVNALVHAMYDERCRGPFNVVGPNPVRYNRFAGELGQQLGRPTVVPAPALALKAMLGQRADVMLASQRVVPRRLEQLGFEFRFAELNHALADCCAADDILIRPATAWPTTDYLSRRQPKYVLEQDLVVQAPLDDVFSFFSDARNLSLLTPPTLDFHIKTPDVTMAVGARIDYRIKLGVMPMRWTSSIEVWKPGSRFVDAQVRGPYHCWWHEHSFEERSGGTLVRDRVYYAPPLGPLGRVANRLFVSPNLRRIFAFRRAAVRLRFGPSSRTAAARRLFL